MLKKYLLFAIIFVCLITGINAQGWQKVSSVSELIGRWDGSFVLDIPENLAEMVPKSHIDVRMELNCTATNYELYMIMNFNSFLDRFIEIPEIKASGLTKDFLWMFIAMSMEEQDQMDLKIMEDEYALSAVMSGTADELLVNDNGEVYISANKRTLRLVFDDRMTLGLGDEGLSEIVLSKR